MNRLRPGTRADHRIGSKRYMSHGVKFDGTSDWMEIAAPSGISDSKVGTISFFYRCDGGNGTTRRIFMGAMPTPNFTIQHVTDNTIQLICRTSSSTDIVNMKTSAITSGTKWYHILASWNAGITTAHYYVNNVSDKTVTTLVDNTIDYSATTPGYSMGAAPGTGLTKMNGSISDFWFSMSDYVDLSLDKNRGLFISKDNRPIFLGNRGELATGNQPNFYFNGQASVFNVNRGSAGNFTITGSFDPTSTDPSIQGTG